MFGTRPTFVLPFLIKSIPRPLSISTTALPCSADSSPENLDLLSALSHRLREQSHTGSTMWAEVADFLPMHGLLLLACLLYSSCFLCSVPLTVQ